MAYPTNIEYIVDGLEEIAEDTIDGDVKCSDPRLLQRLLDACHEIHDKYLRNKLEDIIEQLEVE